MREQMKRNLFPVFFQGDNNQFPAIWSDEGKYLASVLGDALVKGLTQVSQERPDDPVEYLANFLRRYGQDSRGHDLEHKRIDSPAIPDSAIAQAAAAATVTSVAIHNHIQRNPSLEEVEEMTEEPTTDEPENENSSTEAITEEVGESEQIATTHDEELPGETEVEDDKAEDENKNEAEDENKNEAEDENKNEDEDENKNEDEDENASTNEGSGEVENQDEEQVVMDTEETKSISGPDAETEEESKLESQTEVESQTEGGPGPSEAEDEENEDAELLRRLDDEVAEQNADDEDEDAIQVQPDEKEEEVEGTGQRDERGQSVLHFAAARPGGAQTLLSFLHNPVVNLAWRDERFKTARDVASSLHRTENIQAIDSYVISRALGGDVETLEKLLLDGYDHITESEDENQNSIMELTEKAGQTEVIKFLKSVPEFHENLDNLMDAIRLGDLDRVKQSLEDDPRLAITVGRHGRTPLHVAVLCEEYSIVQYIAQQFPQALRRGDNLERTALHYAMGIEKVEKMTRILVRMGAKRVLKDIKGRQPSYYFINREEIAILQEEEKTS